VAVGVVFGLVVEPGSWSAVSTLPSTSASWSDPAASAKIPMACIAKNTPTSPSMTR